LARLLPPLISAPLKRVVVVESVFPPSRGGEAEKGVVVVLVPLVGNGRKGVKRDSKEDETEGKEESQFREE